jgi:GTP-binding protein
MKPIIAILGRPNVGKSTLFNRLTRSRDALVTDAPGLTRDRLYGIGRIGDSPYAVVDTGGLYAEPEGLAELIASQALQAAKEADGVLFLVDGRQGLTPQDEAIAREIRSLNKPIQLAVNKTEDLDPDLAVAEFHALGLGAPIPISSAHGQGVSTLITTLLASLPVLPERGQEQEAQAGIKIAVIGRPNVGKSTLVNRILGEQRVLVYDTPGTTRDSIAIPFTRNQKPYTLIDTAGIRRRARVTEVIEKFSVIKTLQTLERAEVAVVLIDATESVTDQDASLIGMVLEQGRALLIAVNKWDGLTPEQRRQVKKDVDRRLRFVDFAPLHYISALHGSGVGELFPTIDKAYQSAFIEVSTATLTQILHKAVESFPPPLVRGRRIKLRYAHLGGHNPPRVVIHGNQIEALPGSYRRYLEKSFRVALALEGTPLRIEFKQGENPFKGKKNLLNPRPIAKRKRLMRHVRGIG